MSDLIEKLEAATRVMTSGARHTPGPWRWTDNDYNGRKLISNDKVVLEAFVDFSPEPGEGMDGYGIEVSDEDAALIVTAVNERPALLAANRALRDLLADLVRETDGHVKSVKHRDAARILLAALDKEQT